MLSADEKDENPFRNKNAGSVLNSITVIVSLVFRHISLFILRKTLPMND